MLKKGFILVVVIAFIHVIYGQVPEVSVDTQDASGFLNQISTVTCTYIINNGTFLSAAWYSGTSTVDVANELVHSIGKPTNGRFSIDVTQPGIATLTITDTTLLDEGYYSCLINNNRGRSNGGIASLVVQYFNSLTFTSTDNPVTVNSSTVLNCSVDAKPDPLIIFTKDGQEVSRGTTKELVHTISNVEESDAGTYTCQATNDAGHMSSELKLVVHYGPETPLLEHLFLYPGESRIISTDVSCNPTCTYLWNTDLPGSEDAVKNETTFTLTASINLEDRQMYTYNLAVSNIIGSKSSSAEITISTTPQPDTTTSTPVSVPPTIPPQPPTKPPPPPPPPPPPTEPPPHWLKCLLIGIGILVVVVIIIIIIWCCCPGACKRCLANCCFKCKHCFEDCCGCKCDCCCIPQCCINVKVCPETVNVGDDAVMRFEYCGQVSKASFTWYKCDESGRFNDADPIVHSDKPKDDRFSLTEEGLQICNVKKTDDGYYLCMVTENGKNVKDFNKLTVNEKLEECSFPTGGQNRTNEVIPMMECKDSLSRYQGPQGGIYTQVNPKQKNPEKESKPAQVDKNVEGLTYAHLDFDLTRDLPKDRKDTIHHPEPETTYASIQQQHSTKI